MKKLTKEESIQHYLDAVKERLYAKDWYGVISYEGESYPYNQYINYLNRNKEKRDGYLSLYENVFVTQLLYFLQDNLGGTYVLERELDRGTIRITIIHRSTGTKYLLTTSLDELRRKYRRTKNGLPTSILELSYTPQGVYYYLGKKIVKTRHYYEDIKRKELGLKQLLLEEITGLSELMEEYNLTYRLTTPMQELLEKNKDKIMEIMTNYHRNEQNYSYREDGTNLRYSHWDYRGIRVYRASMLPDVINSLGDIDVGKELRMDEEVIYIEQRLHDIFKSKGIGNVGYDSLFAYSGNYQIECPTPTGITTYPIETLTEAVTCTELSGYYDDIEVLGGKIVTKEGSVDIELTDTGVISINKKTGEVTTTGDIPSLYINDVHKVLSKIYEE